MCDPKIDRKTVPTNVKISLQPLSLNYWPRISATISKQHECCLYFFLAKQNHKLSAVSECCCCKCSSVAPHNTQMTSESFCFFKPLIALSFPFMLHFILQVQTASQCHEPCLLRKIFHMEDTFSIMGNRENCCGSQRMRALLLRFGYSQYFAR